jgi:hypothetical protein
VAAVAKLTCSWVATMGWLQKEMLATVGRDVLQLAHVSPTMERRGSLLDFPRPFLGSLTPTLFRLSMQRLAQDATEVADLREEVTWVWAAAIMVEDCAPRWRRWPRKGPSCWLLPTGSPTRWLKGSLF